MGLNVGLISTWKTRCGIASYSANLANALAGQGVNVYVVRIPRYGFRDPSIFQNVIEKISVDKLDVLHCEHEYGLYQGIESHFFPSLKSLGKPIVTTMHSVGNWEIDGVVAMCSSKVIVHNQFCAGRFGYPDKTCIIPHGLTPLETPLPPRDACKKHLGIQPEVPIVGYVGFISNYKGLETLIEAMVKVPNVALLIGGGWFVEKDTAYIGSLKERTLKELPNRCQWLGFVPDDGLSTVYGAMDIVVYPSRFITESGALLMALSHGKAVIASDLAPIREKAKQGALMTFKGVNDLAKKIRELLQDINLRHKYEEVAQQYSRWNSWTSIAEKHIDLYEQVIASYKEG